MTGVPRRVRGQTAGRVTDARDGLADLQRKLKLALLEGLDVGEPACDVNSFVYLTGEYPLRFDGNGKIAGILTGLQLMGMPRDYVNTRNPQIEAVTVDDVSMDGGVRLDLPMKRWRGSNGWLLAA